VPWRTTFREMFSAQARKVNLPQLGKKEIFHRQTVAVSTIWQDVTIQAAMQRSFDLQKLLETIRYFAAGFLSVPSRKLSDCMADFVPLISCWCQDSRPVKPMFHSPTAACYVITSPPRAELPPLQGRSYLPSKGGATRGGEGGYFSVYWTCIAFSRGG